MDRGLGGARRGAQRLGWLVAALALGVAAHGWAQTGVDDDRVSLPDGPGSLEGVGDNVDVDPNMGFMSYSVPLGAPLGFPGVSAEPVLSYSSGGGSGIVGMGWSLAMPSIERMASKGVPRYDADDRFASDGGDELVRVESTAGRAVYRERYEGAFVRYTWVDPGPDGYWIAEYPDGRTGWFGATPDGTLVPQARTADAALGTFRYALVEVRDQWDHRLRYTYDLEGGAGDNTPLLRSIEYVFVGEQPRYTVSFDYEDRPDTQSDCGGGFEVRLSRRLAGVQMYADAELIREVRLAYQQVEDSGGASRLARVRSYGLGGAADGPLFPVSFTFDYSRALGVACQGEGCDRPTLVDMGVLQGAVNLGAGTATFIDINGDGLPDVLDTSGEGPHRFHLNTLTPDGDGFAHGFAAPVESAVANGGGFRLSAANVQTLDINGDGYADLVDTQSGAFLLNGGRGSDWAMAGDGIEMVGLPSFAGDGAASLRFIDLDNDKRIDLLQATSGATRAWFNEGDSFRTAELEAIGPGFATANLQLADMNGDGLNDPVEIGEAGSVRYKLNLGAGRFSAEWKPIPGADVAPAEQELVDLEDLNGDGLSDLVVVNSGLVKYALNTNGTTFEPFRTIESDDIDGVIPERGAGVTVLYADMNANGSEDVVWFAPNGAVQYLELFPVRPHLLSRIDNGIGMVQRIDYGSSVEHAARAAAAGEPWDVTLPNPMLVVDRIDTYVTLTGADDGSGFHELTEYRYRNGFYDGEEKQFRGFTDVTLTRLANEAQAEGVTVFRFDNGLEDDAYNGKLLETATFTGGEPLEVRTMEYADCPVDGIPPAGELREAIRFVCPVATERVLQEDAPAAEWVTLRDEMTYDGYGNVILAAMLGDVDREGDERYKATTYVAPDSTGGLWLLGRAARRVQYSDPDDPQQSEVRVYYDGEPFVGLPEGQLTRGAVTRQTLRIASGDDTVIESVRQRIDPTSGQVVEAFDPLGDPADPTTHRTIWQYDDAGQFAVLSESFLLDPDGAPYSVRRTSRWDVRWGQRTEVSAPMVVRDGAPVTPANATRIRLDDFGRPVAWLLPGDMPQAPTLSYEYVYGDPVSHVLLTRRLTANEISVSKVCFDGRGGVVQERDSLGDGAVSVSGFKLLNSSGNTVRSYQRFLSDTMDCDTAPPEDVLFTALRYDASGRVLEVERPDGALYGTPSVTRTAYGPLTAISWDPEDNDPESPHFDTPSTVLVDGLGRLRAIQRVLGGEVATWEVAYDNLDNVARVTDPEGNAYTQVFDLIGRPTEATTPHHGTTRFAYDDAGNQISRTDARGVTVAYTFDGRNRLVSRFDPDAPETSRVDWRWDADPTCDPGECTQLAGRLASVTYPLGEGQAGEARGIDRFGYDIRGNVVLEARNLDGVDLVVRRAFDTANRLRSMTLPDGGEVALERDEAGQITAIPGFVDAVIRSDRQLLAEVRFSNGATETRAYDDIQRLVGLSVTDAGGDAVLDMGYGFDRTGNLLAITDRAPGRGPRGLEATLDDWYRPLSVELAPGAPEAETLTLDYGLLDQILSRTSSRPGSPANIGAYTYEPDAPTRVATAGELDLEHDAAGNVVQRGEQTLDRDFLGRMTEASDAAGAQVTSWYGPGRARVAKQDAGAWTLYGPQGYVVRDGVGYTYVALEGRRVARRASLALQPVIYPDVAPVDAADGAISAGDAWVAWARNEGVAEGQAVDAAPQAMLAAAARRLLVESEDATRWLHHDHLDSVVAATDGGGAVRGARAWYPFGQPWWSEGDVDAYGFTGQEHDVGTGLIAFASRFYDPHTARWASADPQFTRLTTAALEAQLSDAIGGFSYVGNGPLDHIDPLGLNKKKKNRGDDAKVKTKSKKKKPKKKKKRKKDDDDDDGAGATPSGDGGGGVGDGDGDGDGAGGTGAPANAAARPADAEASFVTGKNGDRKNRREADKDARAVTSPKTILKTVIGATAAGLVTAGGVVLTYELTQERPPEGPEEVPPEIIPTLDVVEPDGSGVDSVDVDLTLFHDQPPLNESGVGNSNETPSGPSLSLYGLEGN